MKEEGRLEGIEATDLLQPADDLAEGETGDLMQPADDLAEKMGEGRKQAGGHRATDLLQPADDLAE